MKKFYMFIVMFTVSTFLLNNKCNAQTTFSNVYSLTSKQSIITNAGAPLADSSFIVAGQLDKAGYLLRINYAGNQVWGKAVNGSIFNTIIATKDSCFIAAGGNGFLKINPQGTILWSKTIINDTAVTIIGAEPTSDSGFIFTGYTTSSPLFSHAFIAKVNANGNNEWVKFITIGDLENQGITIKQAPDGSYFLGGQFKNKSDLKSHVFLIKLTTVGNIVLQKSYGSNVLFNDMEITNTGLVLYLDHPTTILKTDFSGAELWIRPFVFPYPNLPGGSTYNKINKTSDGSVIFTRSGCNKNVVAKMSSSGSFIWAKSLNLLVVEAIETSDKGYVILGAGPGCNTVFKTENTISASEIGVIKTAISGNSSPASSCVANTDLPFIADHVIDTFATRFISNNIMASNSTATISESGIVFSSKPGCITSTVAENDFIPAVTISPNPFSTQTSVHTNLNLKNATVTIFNSLGQQVRQFNDVSGKSINIQRDNLTSGLYFISVSYSIADKKSETADVITGKFIITDN